MANKVHSPEKKNNKLLEIVQEARKECRTSRLQVRSAEWVVNCVRRELEEVRAESLAELEVVLQMQRERERDHVRSLLEINPSIGACLPQAPQLQV
jgi:hypothetical protein